MVRKCPFNAVQIEEFSIIAVRSEITKFNNIKPAISENDKGPSWDGFVEYYRDNTFSKGSMIRRIPVQLKGHYVEEFSGENATFQVNVDDLRNWFNEGVGLLFLYVEVNGSGETKIYYASLLPYDLSEYVKVLKHNQKSKSIEVSKLSDVAHTSFNILCKNFIDHTRMQKNTDISENERKEFKQLKTIFTTENSKISEYLLNNEIYVYGENEHGRTIPITKAKVTSVIKPLEVDVSIGGYVYFSEVASVESGNGKSFRLGNNIYFEEGRLINHTRSGNVYERINDLRFIKKLFSKENDGFDIGSKFIPFNSTLESLKELEEIEEMELELAETISLFEYLGVEFIIPLEKLSKSDIRTLSGLKNMYKKRGNYFDGKPGTGLYKVTILDVTLTILISEVEGEFYLYNFFESELNNFSAVKRTDTGDTVPVSRFIMMNAEHILSENFNSEVVYESIQSYENIADFASEVNDLVINLIASFDISKTKTELLSLAGKLVELLILKCDETVIMNSILQINKYQIICRQRKLRKEEKRFLIEMKDSTEDKVLVGAILLLLNYFVEFEILFESLDDTEKGFICDYPIYQLYKPSST